MGLTYEVATVFKLTDDMSVKLEGIYSRTEKLHRALTQLSSLTIGFGAIHGLESFLRPAADYQRQWFMIKSLGTQHLETVRKITDELSNTNMAISPTTAMHIFQDMQLALPQQFKDPKMLASIAPEIGKAFEVLMATGKGGAAGATNQVFGIMKSLEEVGFASDARTFAEHIRLMTRSLVAFSGRLSAMDFQSTFKFARAASFGWDNEFRYKELPYLMLAMKGAGGGVSGGAGNPLMSLHNMVVSGVFPRRNITGFEKYGLLKGPISPNFTTTLTTQSRHPLVNSDLMLKDPFKYLQWLIKRVEAVDRKAGVSITPANERQYIVKTVSSLFAGVNRTALGIILTALLNEKNIKATRKRLEAVHSMDDIIKSGESENLWFQLQLTGVQFNRLITKLGQLHGSLNYVIEKLNQFLHYLGNLADKYPKWASAIGTAIVALIGATGLVVTLGIVSGSLLSFGRLLKAINAIGAVGAVAGTAAETAGVAAAGGASAGWLARGGAAIAGLATMVIDWPALLATGAILGVTWASLKLRDSIEAANKVPGTAEHKKDKDKKAEPLPVPVHPVQDKQIHLTLAFTLDGGQKRVYEQIINLMKNRTSSEIAAVLTRNSGHAIMIPN